MIAPDKLQSEDSICYIAEGFYVVAKPYFLVTFSAKYRTSLFRFMTRH